MQAVEDLTTLTMAQLTQLVPPEIHNLSAAQAGCECKESLTTCPCTLRLITAGNDHAEEYFS